jgi:hypothetical protein
VSRQAVLWSGRVWQHAAVKALPLVPDGESFAEKSVNSSRSRKLYFQSRNRTPALLLLQKLLLEHMAPRKFGLVFTFQCLGSLLLCSPSSAHLMSLNKKRPFGKEVL